MSQEIYDVTGKAVSIDQLMSESEAAVPVALLSLVQTGNSLTFTFSNALDTAQKTALDGAVAAHSPVATKDTDTVSISNAQGDGAIMVAATSRIASGFNYATHNFTDKCTWFSESARRTGVTLVQAGTRWVCPDQYIVDMYHGRISDEEGMVEDQAIFEPSTPHGYKLNVYKDGALLSESKYFWEGQHVLLETGTGDYYVDYTSGVIYPSAPGSFDGAAMTADYSCAQTAGWILKPTPGKGLFIEESEVQFSNPFTFTTAIVMQAFGSANFFAPHLVASNGGPYPDGTSVPITGTVWKTLDQIHDETRGSLPEIPAMGGDLRGVTRPRHILQFEYSGSRRLYSSLGMFMKIGLEGDIPLGGERATATFYGTSQVDTDPMAALKQLGLV